MKTEIVAPDNATEKLLLLAAFEKQVKRLRQELKESLPGHATYSTRAGKVTLTEASRLKVDKQALYTALVTKGINPMNWGKCEVTVSEANLSKLISNGTLTTEQVESFTSETTYETLRVTPEKEISEHLEAVAHSSFTNLLSNTTQGLYLIGESDD